MFRPSKSSYLLFQGALVLLSLEKEPCLNCRPDFFNGQIIADPNSRDVQLCGKDIHLLEFENYSFPPITSEMDDAAKKSSQMNAEFQRKNTCLSESKDCVARSDREGGVEVSSELERNDLSTAADRNEFHASVTAAAHDYDKMRATSATVSSQGFFRRVVQDRILFRIENDRHFHYSHSAVVGVSRDLAIKEQRETAKDIALLESMRAEFEKKGDKESEKFTSQYKHLAEAQIAYWSLLACELQSQKDFDDQAEKRLLPLASKGVLGLDPSSKSGGFRKSTISDQLAVNIGKQADPYFPTIPAANGFMESLFGDKLNSQWKSDRKPASSLGVGPGTGPGLGIAPNVQSKLLKGIIEDATIEPVGPKPKLAEPILIVEEDGALIRQTQQREDVLVSFEREKKQSSLAFSDENMRTQSLFDRVKLKHREKEQYGVFYRNKVDSFFDEMNE